jgi:exopolyphosphatase/guanosine-5'-triphosphate,3'-diphosphate pyrophosphatase
LKNLKASQIAKTFDDIELRESTKVAVLDIGSNSFHLVVARIISGTVQILHKTKIKVRLASGLSKDNILSLDAIERGLEALQVIKSSLEGFEPESVRIIATYTLRKAKNSWRFVEAAKSIFPYPVEIIAGQEEARLIFNGVANNLPLENNSLVIDIGGGSTEFIIGKELTPIIMRSLDMGCVSFSQNYFAQNKIKAKSFNKAITAAMQRLELIEEKYKKTGWTLCIGTSGTIESIMQICTDGRLETYITLQDLEQLKTQLIEFGSIENIHLPAASEDRIAVLPAGLAILIAIFKSLKIDKLEFNSAALREGAIYEMDESLSDLNIRERSVQSLATRYDVDTEQANLVLGTAYDLFAQVHKEWGLTNKFQKPLLGWACLLHEIGLHINSRGVQKHSFYILNNAELPGFNAEQQAFVSYLTLFHRKKIDLSIMPRFGQFTEEEFIKCMIILRISCLLNIKRQPEFVPKIQLETSKRSLTLSFEKDWLELHPVIAADLEKEQSRLSKISYQLNIGTVS